MCGRMDLTRYRRSLHAHDFTPGGTSRVVMVRKKEQRTFSSPNPEIQVRVIKITIILLGHPQLIVDVYIGFIIQGGEIFETLTKETVQTYRGNRIERKITSQKRDPDIADHLSSITIQGTYHLYKTYLISIYLLINPALLVICTTLIFYKFFYFLFKPQGTCKWYHCLRAPQKFKN